VATFYFDINKIDNLNKINEFHYTGRILDRITSKSIYYICNTYTKLIFNLTWRRVNTQIIKLKYINIKHNIYKY